MINLQSGNLFLQDLTTSLSSSMLSNLTLPDNISLENRTFILCRNPSIWVYGRTIFPYASVPNYVISAAGDSVQIDGGVVASIDGGVIFKFDCSSNSIIVLSNFSYDRAFPLELTPDQQQNNIVYWEIGAVPWVPILNSSTFVICVIIVVVVLLAVQTFYQLSIIIGKRKLSVNVDHKTDSQR